MSTVETAAKIIGLSDSQGFPSTNWLHDPFTPLTQILSNDEQRQALLDLLDQLWPAQNPPGVPGNEKWHPILGPQSAGNFYLTVANGSRPLTLGLAGERHSGAGPLGAALRARVPLVTVNAGAVNFVAGTQDGPFELELRVELDWSVAGGQAIGLGAIRASAVLQPLATPPASLKIVLEGLSVNGAAPKDTELDAAHLDSQALQLVLGLLQEELRQLAAGGPPAGLAALTEHLMPLLGLAPGFPALPVLTLVSNASAFRDWAASLISAGKAADWLGHLGGLFGVASAATGSGTTADPWTVPVFTIDAKSVVSLTLAQSTEPHTGTGRVDVGLRISYDSTNPALGARIDAAAVLASIPLGGSPTAAALPSASIVVVAPGGAVAKSVRGGAVWNGTAVVPLLELDDVTLTIAGSTAHYDRIDLTNTDSVISAASGTVAGAITSALGATGAGAHLAALAGLTKPASDPGWTHLADLALLISNPGKAISAVHRSALLDATHNWSALFREIAGLLGLAGAVSGAGTMADPWIVALAPGILSVDLAAWNAESSHGAADTQQLRIGLRARAASAPWTFSWLCELLAFDLPASGDGRVALLAGQHASFSLQPVPESLPVAGVTVAADSVGITLDYVPGSPVDGRANISGLTVASGADSVHFPTLSFPAPAGFAITADVEKALRLLFPVALGSWLPGEGAALSALLGLTGDVLNLSADWPLIAPGFLTDPFGALRTWLGHVARDVSSDQLPFLPRALQLLPALFGGSPALYVSGSGLYDDPWSVPVDTGMDLLTWLEPAGPPATWAASEPALIGAAASFNDLFAAAQRLGAFLPAAREAISDQSPVGWIAGLQTLSDWLAVSDGFVPQQSQVPITPEWTAGTPLHSAHTAQPSDAAAIAQINAQIATWNPAAKVVLLLGPSFSDHRIWDALLAPVAVKPNFNFRVPGMDPATLDLHGVTDAADFYTADFADNGLAGIAAQIGRVVARIGELRPGVKVTLVAHSTAGVAARVFAAANAGLVQGIITLGTPHAGSILLPLTDQQIGTALRALGTLAPKLRASPLNDALTALTQAADGYLSAAKAGDLPVASTFPVASFADPGSTETGGVPALAIGSTIAADLLTEVKTALAAAAGAIAGPAPTHLGIGLRARVDFGIGGDIQVDAYLRADAGRIALSSGAAEPPRPAHGLNAYVALSRPSGWLAGSPSSPERVRSMEMGLKVAPGKIGPWFRLHDAAFHSPSLGLADETNPNLQSLLGVVFHQIASPAPSAGTALANLLAALSSPFQMVVPSAGGALSLSSDALIALNTDPVGFLSSRLNFKKSLGPNFEIAVTGVNATLRSTSTAAPINITGALSLPDLKPSIDLSFTLGAATISYSQATGTVTFAAPPWIAPTTSITAALTAAVPRVLLSSAVTAILQSIIGPGFKIGPIDAFLTDPGAALRSVTSLGTGTCLDSAKIGGLLKRVGRAIGVPSTGDLTLPGNLKLAASGTGTVNLQLSTTAPIGGVLSIALGAQIDCGLHVTPAGSVTLTQALPGTWGNTNIRFTVGASGVTLTVEPTGVAPIQILPTFSGLGALAGGATALLPAALDALSAAVPASTLSAAALDLATALDLYDAAGKFSAHASQWKTLLDGNWSATVGASARAAAATAITNILKSVNLGALGSAGVSVNAGWDTQPTVSINATGLSAAGGAVSADFTLGYKNAAILAKADINLNLNLIPGIKAVPRVSVEFAAGQFQVTVTPGTTDPVQDLLLPLAAELVLTAEKANFSKPVWTGGPTVLDLLQNAKLTTGAGDLASPMPPVLDIVTGLAAGLASHAALKIGDFTLAFVTEGTKTGVRLAGSQKIPSDEVDLTVHFGADAFAKPGVTVWVLNSGQFAPSLDVRGLGIELGGASGGPLLNSGGFRLQSAAGYLFFTFNGTIGNLGGAIAAQGFGLPLNLLGGSHDGGNAVASSLLEGVGTGGGDPHPVNPAVDVLVSYVDGAFHISLGAKSPIWIGVHRAFGPIYIDQIGVEWDNSKASMLVDASIQLGPLVVQAYELSLGARFTQLKEPENWMLDLQGLAVGFDAGPVSIAGGLIKNPGPPLDYDGMLSAVIAGIGLTVVGGYSKPNDGQGSYTSLFLFVSLPIPLGGPPFLFVTGLGGGAGYNRQLLQPTDMNQIPDYFLVKAIDDSNLANDPMGALVSMGNFVKPRRGSFWLSAGLRFNSFVVVNCVAVVWVAIDRGFDLGAIGVARMQLPAPGIELVSIELALMIKFSESEGYFGVRAQLTDNSWIFSRDCQLTGGFAFYIFFKTGHFVLTIGGYHPAFNKPPEFPDVPRLGFNWQVLGFVQIKGESYFAITSSAFMCGGRLEASAGIGGIRAWFTVHADILIQWDPFHYDFDAGIEVGVSLTIHVCFFGACVDIGITISKGADIHIFGPPFHADVTFDAYITTITLSFGETAHPRPDPLPWGNFRDKYLVSGNPENTWVGVRMTSGLLLPDPPGAQPSPGTQDDPWKLNPEWSFVTETRMPASGYRAGGVFDNAGAVIQLPFKSLGDSRSWDLAPMDVLKVGSNHTFTITPPVTHPDQFVISEITTPLPEANWVYYDPTHLPAAANRINAITGLSVTATSKLQGKSALIPIGTLKDDDPRYAQPLPFATLLDVIGSLQVFGLTSEALAAITAVAKGPKLLDAATQVLSGVDSIFSSARTSAGLPTKGLSPLAVRALKTGRSAPPLLTPLTTGLSMKPVQLALPPAFFRPPSVDPVALDQPRLRAVMQHRPLPTIDVPPAVRTTVLQTSAPNAPRMAPPQLKILAGARLDFVPAANAARNTAVTFGARTVRNADLGALSGNAHTQAFASAASNFTGDGITVPAGTTHVWEVPSPTNTLTLRGDAAVRVTTLNRAGQTIGDLEMAVSGSRQVPISGAEYIAISCLGSLPAMAVQLGDGEGVITFAASAGGATPAVGWQAGNLFPQVGGSCVLARGAALRLRKAYLPVVNRQKATQSMVRISDALIGQSGAETWLPVAVGVVMILLDRTDSTAAEAGDLGISCDGATLATPPVAGSGGRRRALLYDVIAREQGATRISIAVASKAGWALAGVIGLPGRAVEWAARLHGSVPPDLVPNGPLTASGQISVQLTPVEGGVL
jgi:hypothetical protein